MGVFTLFIAVNLAQFCIQIDRMEFRSIHIRYYFKGELICGKIQIILGMAAKDFESKTGYLI